MRRGDNNTSVELLQKMLSALGYDCGAVDGIFGQKTETAVFDFQRKHNLYADGIVGVKTLAVIESEFEMRNASQEDKPVITLKPITRKLGAKYGRTIKYIVVHYTAGASSAPGRAEKTRDGFQNSTRQASADFCVDDATIVQCNGDIENRYTWAVGDGGCKYGVTNTNSISIEMCSNLKKGTSGSKPNHTGWYLTDEVVDNTVSLVRYLMRRYNIKADNVISHYDASRKLCPGIVGWNPGILYSEDGTKTKESNNETKWHEFKKRIQQ